MPYPAQPDRRRLPPTTAHPYPHGRIVTRSRRGHATVLRRSRGYGPSSAPAPGRGPPGAACGAELKTPSASPRAGAHSCRPHRRPGELPRRSGRHRGSRALLRLLLTCAPKWSPTLHPEYLSTKYPMDLGAAGLDLVGVQHHHAHIASCLVDNAETGPAIGVALDGLGLGTTGPCGEVRSCSPPVRLRTPRPPGTGRHAGRHRRHPRSRGAWRRRTWTSPYDGSPPWDLAVPAPRGQVGPGPVHGPQRDRQSHDVQRRTPLRRRLRPGLRRDAVNYEGQAAIELETARPADEDGAYTCP